MMKQGTKPIAHDQPVTLANAPSRSIRMNAGTAHMAAKIAANTRNMLMFANSLILILL